MNHLETIKKAVEWARKNPQAYAEFVERRRREAEEDAAIEAEARAEDAKERQAAKEAEEKAAKGPVISISGESVGKGTAETPAAPTPPTPPPGGENKPVEGAQGAGEGNAVPQPPDAPQGAESANGEGKGEEGESAQDEGGEGKANGNGESEGGMTFTDDDGNTYTLPPPEIDEVSPPTTTSGNMRRVEARRRGMRLGYEPHLPAAFFNYISG